MPVRPHGILTPTVVDGANGAAWWQNDKAGDGAWWSGSDGVSGLDRARRRSPRHLQARPSAGIGRSSRGKIAPACLHRAAGKAWVKTPVDAFILAGLKKAGFRPRPRPIAPR